MKSLIAPYDEVALVLQGGGALGSYQAGIIEAISEVGIEPTWVAGVSIGAINAALVAGNPLDRRVEAIREFWDRVSHPGVFPSSPRIEGELFNKLGDGIQQFVSVVEGIRSLLEGRRGFFSPRLPEISSTPDRLSFYDTTPLKKTLLDLVDFELLNSGKVRLSVSAVNLATGRETIFDSAHRTIRPEHIMASGALPPGFPAVEVDGEYFWDGGLVSNTPLMQVLGGHPKSHTLVFQVDLWNGDGRLPQNLLEVPSRMKDIQFASRSNRITDLVEQAHDQRVILRRLLELIPEQTRQATDFCREVEEMANDKRYNVLRLNYLDKPYDIQDKDFQFGNGAMLGHWACGVSDMRRALSHPSWFKLPSEENPFVQRAVRTKVADA